MAQLAEPGRCWIRFSPRVWPDPPQPSTQLAAGTIAWGRSADDHLPLAAGTEALDDLLYLPPVPAEREGERRELAERHATAGTPVLVQLSPGQTWAAMTGTVVAYDLLPAFLARDLTSLDEVSAGALAVWPLLPGLSDAPELWQEGCARLAAAGAAAVQALVPRLAPADRRQLVDRLGEAAFEAVFHGAPPAERSFAQVAARYGLAPFLPRPLPRPPVRGVENRRLAGALALAAELWLRLGRPASQGQALYAAARQADRTPYDLAAVSREGNLGVLGWLTPAGRDLVSELAATGASTLLEELSTEYLSEGP